MTTRSGKLLVTALLSFGVALALASCGAQPSSPALEATPQEVGSAEPEVEPRVFTFASGQEIGNFDPGVISDYPGSLSNHALYDTLFRVTDDPIRVEPWLVTEVETSQDLREWTFHLDERAVFHDGSPVTAEAVAYTFERQMAMQSGFAWMWADITDENSVEVLDDHTVRFTLTQPYAPFPGTLAYLPIVNPDAIQAHETNGDWGTGWMLENEAGSGPYTLSRVEPGDFYEFVAVPDYWHGWTDGSYAEILRYKVYRESTTGALAMLAGEVDWMTELTEEDIALLEGQAGVEVSERPSLSLFFIFMNTASDGPMGDVNVRAAMRYAFNYAGIPEAITGIKLTDSIIPESMPEAVVFPDAQTTDLEMAREFLSRSAWPDGGFAIDYVYVTGFTPEETAGLMLLEALSSLNIQVNMVPRTWPEMVEACGTVESTPDTIAMYIGAPLPDPSSYLYQSFGATPVRDFNTCHWYFDDEVMGMISSAISEPDEQTRNDLFSEVQRRLFDAQFGILIGLQYFPEAHNSHWQGQNFSPVWGYLGYLEDYSYVP